MLSGDVLSCSGVFGWNRGNFLMYLNKQFGFGQDVKYVAESSKASIYIAVYQCIYKRGQWKRACGESVDKTIRKIVNKFILIVKRLKNVIVYRNLNEAICNRCKKDQTMKPSNTLET